MIKTNKKLSINESEASKLQIGLLPLQLNSYASTSVIGKTSRANREYNDLQPLAICR